MANVVEQLMPAGDGASGRSLTTTETAAIEAMPGVERLRISGPLSYEARVSSDIDGTPRAIVGPIPRVGVYRIEGARERDGVLPVNLVNPVESAIATSDTVEVAGRAARSAGLGDAAPREIWHWFVLGAFGLLLLEWFLFAFRTRV